MTKYIATFADGATITRTSDHAYTVAWRATWTTPEGRAYARTGFAVSQSKANPDKPHHPRAPIIYRGCSANTRSNSKRMNEEWRVKTGYVVEFAEAAPTP